jgi:hypothetical protein
MSWSVTVPMKLASAANARKGRGGFARSRAAAAHVQVGFLAVTGNPGTPSLPVTVLLVRVGPRVLDDDNLAFAFKSVRDGVAQGLGVKDHDPRVSWTYAQERGPYAIRVEIGARA